MFNNRSEMYGSCEYCGSPLQPVWFTEKEYEISSNGVRYATGRQRRACSHLVCMDCLKNFAVDDTFDGPWEKIR